MCDLDWFDTHRNRLPYSATLILYHLLPPTALTSNCCCGLGMAHFRRDSNRCMPFCSSGVDFSTGIDKRQCILRLAVRCRYMKRHRTWVSISSVDICAVVDKD